MVGEVEGKALSNVYKWEVTNSVVKTEVIFYL